MKSGVVFVVVVIGFGLNNMSATLDKFAKTLDGNGKTDGQIANGLGFDLGASRVVLEASWGSSWSDLDSLGGVMGARLGTFLGPSIGPRTLQIDAKTDHTCPEHLGELWRVPESPGEP